jgi:hypothetical protein
LLIVKGTYALLVEDVVIVLKSSKVFTFCLLLKCLVGFLSFFRPVFFFFFFLAWCTLLLMNHALKKYVSHI